MKAQKLITYWLFRVSIKICCWFSQFSSCRWLLLSTWNWTYKNCAIISNWWDFRETEIWLKTVKIYWKVFWVFLLLSETKLELSPIPPQNNVITCIIKSNKGYRKESQCFIHKWNGKRSSKVKPLLEHTLVYTGWREALSVWLSGAHIREKILTKIYKTALFLSVESVVKSWSSTKLRLPSNGMKTSPNGSQTNYLTPKIWFFPNLISIFKGNGPSNKFKLISEIVPPFPI